VLLCEGELADAEALIAAAAGRDVALNELAGGGVETLRAA
jgi:hypothetical protein